MTVAAIDWVVVKVVVGSVLLALAAGFFGAVAIHDLEWKAGERRRRARRGRAHDVDLTGARKQP